MHARFEDGTVIKVPAWARFSGGGQPAVVQGCFRPELATNKQAPIKSTCFRPDLVRYWAKGAKR